MAKKRSKTTAAENADRDKRLLGFLESNPRYAPIFGEGGVLDQESRALHAVIGLWQRLFPGIPYSDASMIHWLASEGITPMAAQRMTYFEAEKKLRTATEKTSSLADGGPWSTADTPARWAKLFKVSVRTFKRRTADGKIRAKHLSDRLYQVHLDDLPKQGAAKESGHK